MISDHLHNSLDARRFYLGMGWLILAAWVLLIAWQNSAYHALLGHEAIEQHHFPSSWRMTGFLLNWMLMAVAMMLPGSLLAFTASIQPARQRMKNKWLTLLTILGYLLPWTFFGLLAYLGDNILHRIAESEAPLVAYSEFISPTVLMIAGLYQLTPTKRGYLMRCRPTDSQTQQGQAKAINTAGILRRGLRLGISCLGSCWALMLVMFALGHNRLDWMLVLGGIMAAERLTTWGHRLAWMVGLVLVVWATLWVFAIP